MVLCTLIRIFIIASPSRFLHFFSLFCTAVETMLQDGRKLFSPIFIFANTFFISPTLFLLQILASAWDLHMSTNWHPLSSSWLFRTNFHLNFFPSLHSYRKKIFGGIADRYTKRHCHEMITTN